MFPKKGNNVPGGIGSSYRKPDYAAAVSAGLRAELGGSHRAVKTVMRWTHANERTVKNWFSAKRGPRGEHLIAIIQHSDEVLEVVLRLANRNELVPTKLLLDARQILQEMLSRIDEQLKAERGTPQ